MTNKLKLSKKIRKHGGSGPNVVKLFRGGGCSAPEIVSQYISPPNSHIPAGYDGVQSIFQRVFYTPGAAQTNLITNPSATTSPILHSGGGYIVDPSETIGKTAVVHPYPQKAEPLILDGKVVFQGCESQCGAGKISSYRLKKMSQRRSKSKSHSNSKLKFRSSKSKSRSHTKKVSHRKVVRKEKKHGRHSKRVRRGQRGGNEGEKGNFSSDMMTRDFEGKQPNWNVNTI